MNTFDVLIIGGGAAGLTAALSASGEGARAAVLEAAPRIGRKILASGNGRCNLCNMGAPRYYGGQKLAEAVLAQCPVSRVLDFFHQIGLVTVEEAGGRVYPACGQAAAVLDTLRRALDERAVPVICDAPAKAIARQGRTFAVETPQGVFAAPRVILCCGGIAGGKLGHDGSAYALLTGLGHHLVPPRPALTQLATEKRAVKGLSGLRLPARLTLCDGEMPVSAAQGEVLFADYGVSGVCAMQLSRDADALLRAGKKPMLYIDFSPMLGLVPRIYDRVAPEEPLQNLSRMEAFLRQRAHMLGQEGLLCGLAPRLLAQRLEGLRPDALARRLCAFPCPIIGVRGFENAQVTAGGLAAGEFIPETLASRRIPGLYAAGEMLDVDGDCGGYNLQFAFASGILAGRAAGRSAAKGRE